MSKCWTASKCPEQVCCCSVGTITAGNAVGSAGTLPWIMLTLGMMSRKACVLHSFGDAFVHVTLAADSKGGGACVGNFVLNKNIVMVVLVKDNGDDHRLIRLAWRLSKSKQCYNYVPQPSGQPCLKHDGCSCSRCTL